MSIRIRHFVDKNHGWFTNLKFLFLFLFFGESFLKIGNGLLLSFNKVMFHLKEKKFKKSPLAWNKSPHQRSHLPTNK